MARSIDAKCRKCRRALDKLFLKGDRCASPKCAMVRKAYIPGMHGKSGTHGRGFSEYGTQLAAKQKVKRVYGVLERQFRKHFEEVKSKKGIIGDLLLQRLEMRLDNIAFRMGIGNSRSQARQLVNHGFVRVNGKKVNIPSYEVKAGDVVSINDNRKGRNYVKNLDQVLKNKKDFASWIDFDPAKLEGKIVKMPDRMEIGINVDPQIIVEYYSR